MSAVAELVAEGGYQELTLERIAKLARVSHSTFQRLFEGKEDAFLAAQEETVRRAELALADSLGSESSPWPERVRLGLTALLQAASAEPALAHAFLVESRTAGPRATTVYDDALARFVPVLREGRELSSSPDDLPERLEEGIIGGVAWHLSERLVEGRAEALPGFAPDLLTIVLSPYMGEDRAREFASQPVALADE